MARNKGFIPSGPGEISIQRKQLKVIIESLLPACTEPDIETGMPFRAQAIIANPPAYGESIWYFLSVPDVVNNYIQTSISPYFVRSKFSALGHISA